MSKYQIKDKADEKQVVDHVVNLGSDNQSIQLIRSCCLSIPRRRGLFTRLPYTTYTLSVECDIPDAWVVKPGDSVMKIGYGGNVEKELSILANSNKIDSDI